MLPMVSAARSGILLKQPRMSERSPASLLGGERLLQPPAHPLQGGAVDTTLASRSGRPSREPFFQQGQKIGRRFQVVCFAGLVVPRTRSGPPCGGEPISAHRRAWDPEVDACSDLRTHCIAGSSEASSFVSVGMSTSEAAPISPEFSLGAMARKTLHDNPVHSLIRASREF